MRVADDPFADIPASGATVLPFEPPDWRDEADRAFYGETSTAIARVPLPLQYFDQIEMQLTGLWLVKHLLPAIGIAVLYGHPGSGKTFLALDWSLHVALGWEWHGRKVKQGLVVYICAEGVSGLRNRVEAFKRHHKVTDAPFALIPVTVDMQAPDADVARVIAAVREAEEHCGERAVMVVIDTLSKTFGAGKENTDDMVTYVSNCQRVSNEFECLTVPVHHRPKDAESEDPRGHSSLKGGSETVIIVESGETKKARVTKQKDGEDGIEILFRLKVIELGQDEDGDPVTSCVVEATDVDLVPRGDAPEAKVTRLSDKQRAVLIALDETAERSGIYPPAEIPSTDLNRLKVGKVVKTEDWRARHSQTAGQASDIKPDSIRKEFDRGLVRLKNDGIVRVYGEYSWRTWASVSDVRTTSDKPSDNISNQVRTTRTNGVSPTGIYPALSGSLSEVPRGDCPGADEPPSWMDEAPPIEPPEFGAEPTGDFRDNPLFDRSPRNG